MEKPIGELDKFFSNPFLPGFLLLFSLFRAWTGALTWYNGVAMLCYAGWFALTIRDLRAKQRVASKVESAVAVSSPGGAPAVGSIEHGAQLRNAIELVRRTQSDQTHRPTLPSAAEIRATARPAIRLQRAPLPVALDHRVRSYFGGLPRMPEELAWPENVAHDRFALTFLAQIDLSDLPAVQGSALPRAGTLYFFLDTSHEAPATQECRVLFYPGDASTLPFRDLPANSRRYGADTSFWSWMPETSFWSRATFRFPMEFLVTDSFRDSSAAAPAGAPLDHYPWDAFRADPPDWAFAWVAIDYGAQALVHAADSVLARIGTIAARSDYEAIKQTASSWIARASTEVPHSSCDSRVSTEFVNDWRRLLAAFEATSARLQIRASELTYARMGILIASCYVCATNGASDVIPESYRTALAELTDAAKRLPHHQMLGYGEAVQTAALRHVDNILLLQLMGDTALGWHSTEGCALQFWISPQALEQHDFSAVELTFECD